jgi:zinc ribbon protein
MLGKNKMLIKIMNVIGIPSIIVFFLIYWLATGRINFARGGGSPIYFSEETILFIFIWIWFFALACFAGIMQYLKFFKRDDNKGGASRSEFNRQAISKKTKECSHCGNIIDDRATVCLYCGNKT